MRKKPIICILAMMLLASCLCACSTQGGNTDVEETPARGILLSTTIGPVDAGIIDALITAYTTKNPDITVRYLARGTGKAIELAQAGNIDMVIVHAKSLEEKFVAEGYGTERKDFMYNDYVLVGPSDDPAGVKNSASVSEALKKISDGGYHFISRGDKSGTNVKELEIWTASGITPTGDWYEVYEKGSTGNKATLIYTNEQSAYTIIDRATVITNKDALSNLAVLYENEEIMLNYITIIPCNPEKFANINSQDAADFIAWLTGDEAQSIIEKFGVDKYGEPLFFPNAK
ncbi:MAG: solute-binding protein [Eubacteriaceae bacterium]|nr:solute-binding protein [Eubacteriaceae bacterium]